MLLICYYSNIYINEEYNKMDNELAAFGLMVIMFTGFFILYAYVTGNFVNYSGINRTKQAHIDDIQIKSSPRHKKPARIEGSTYSKYDLNID